MYKSELEFWDKELSGEGPFSKTTLRRNSKGEMSKEFPFFIIPFLEEMKTKTKKLPKVLDLGSGPLSQLAWGAEVKLFNLFPVDPLADEYIKLLKKHKQVINTKYTLIQGEGETLSQKYGEDYFDMVWSHNAIDHSQDPVKVFEEIVKVTKPGGYIVFQGWANEGKNNEYFGLHRHDIYWKDGALYVTTKGGKERIMTPKHLPLILWESYFPQYGVKTWIKVIYQKKV